VTDSTLHLYFLEFRAIHSSKNIITFSKSLSLLTVQLLLRVIFKLQVSVFKRLSFFEFQFGYRNI